MKTQTAVVVQIVDTQMSNNYVRANYRHGLWILGQLTKVSKRLAFIIKLPAFVSIIIRILHFAADSCRRHSDEPKYIAFRVNVPKHVTAD